MSGEKSIQIGERNDHGGRPEDNRDALGHASLMAGHLLVLASGVGGTGGGRMEGNLAVSTVLTQFRTLGDLAVAERLTSALSQANDLLTQRGGQDPSLRGSGASCAAVLVQNGQLFACRSGDIRLYVVRGDQAVDVFPSDPKPSDQAIQEDSVRGSSARIGALGSGFAARILVTAQPIPLAAGDRVVLASPGIHRYLDPRDIANHSGTHLPQVASGKLVDAARQAGARQGISVQVVQFGEGSGLEVEGVYDQPVAKHHALAPDMTMAEGALTADQPITMETEEPVLPNLFASEDTGEFSPLTGTEEAAEIEHQVEARTFPIGLPVKLKGRAANSFEKGNRAQWRMPTAIAASLAALLWVWSVNSPVEPFPEEMSAEAESATESDALEEAQGPGKETRLEARIAPGKLQEGAFGGINADAIVSGGSDGIFWAQVGKAVEKGVVMNAVMVESWLLENEKNESAASEKAKAYLAELSSLRNALAVVALSETDLSQSEIKRLDRIFEEDSFSGAQRLNEYLKNRYDLVGEQVFEGLELYVRQQRTPEVVRVLYTLGQVRPRPGPRTRTWLNERLPLILSDH